MTDVDELSRQYGWEAKPTIRPYTPRRPLTRDDVDAVLDAARAGVEARLSFLATDPQAALDAGVPEQVHPGKVEVLCTVLRQYEREVLDAALKGLTDSGYAGVERVDPEMQLGVGDAFVMRSILVSGPPVDQAEPERVPSFSMVLPGVLADVDLAMGGARVAMRNWLDANRGDLAHCPAGDFVDLVLRFGLTYLTANAMITVAPEGAFDRDLPEEIEEPYATAMRHMVDEAVLRRSSLDAAAYAIRSR